MPNFRKFRKFDFIPPPQCGAVSIENIQEDLSLYRKVGNVRIMRSHIRLTTPKYKDDLSLFL